MTGPQKHDIVLYKHLVCKNKNRLIIASDFSRSINSIHAYRLENLHFSSKFTAQLFAISSSLFMDIVLAVEFPLQE